jgi:hypothetical protein
MFPVSTRQRSEVIMARVNLADLATALDVLEIGPGEYISDLKIDCVTAFNSGTTDVIAVALRNEADDGNAHAFTATVTVAATGLRTLTPYTGDVASGNRKLRITHTPDGTAATAGTLLVIATVVGENRGSRVYG